MGLFKGQIYREPMCLFPKQKKKEKEEEEEQWDAAIFNGGQVLENIQLNESRMNFEVHLRRPKGNVRLWSSSFPWWLSSARKADVPPRGVLPMSGRLYWRARSGQPVGVNLCRDILATIIHFDGFFVIIYWMVPKALGTQFSYFLFRWWLCGDGTQCRVPSSKFVDPCMHRTS